MRLLLVRHGQSICGANGVVGGVRGCSGLTELGFEQVRALRDRFQKESFRADVLLGSTLPRATQTAEVVGEALDLEPVLDPDLVEMIPGDVDGSTWNDWRERYGFDPVAEPDRPLSPNGESINSFNERLQRTFERLASQHDGQTVVACCHGGVVRIACDAGPDGRDIDLGSDGSDRDHRVASRVRALESRAFQRPCAPDRHAVARSLDQELQGFAELVADADNERDIELRVPPCLRLA